MRQASGSLTRPDGVRLATRAWLPADEPDAGVIVLHGMGEHIGRYERLATALVREGLAVHGFDLRGHGASDGPRARIHSIGQLIDDAGAVTASVRRHAHGPWLLFGHSVGALVALRAVQTGALRPDALVLSSPWLRASAMPHPAVLGLLLVLARVVPGVGIARVDAAAVSRDPLEVEAHRSDPAVWHGRVPLGTVAAMLRAGAAALAPDVGPLRLPTLVLHGSGDRVADPEGALELERRNPGLTLHLEPEGHHELFNDTCRAFVTDELLRWLKVRLGAAA